MMSNINILLVILTVSTVTFLLRLLPFIGIKFISRNNYVHTLRQTMPTGIMFLLVAYTLKDLQVTKFPYGLPHIIAMSLAALFYWKTSHSLLAISVSLLLYLITINFIL